MTNQNDTSFVPFQGNVSGEVASGDAPSWSDISPEQYALWERVVGSGISRVLSMFAMFSNVVMVATFAKMGFKETANITMSAIAVWDVAKCFFIAMAYLKDILIYTHPSLQWTYKVSRLFIVRPTTEMCSFVSSCLAAYIAIERSMCVSMPFTVKFLLTRKFTILTCLAISVFVTGAGMVGFVTSTYDFIVDSSDNRTYLMAYISPWAQGTFWTTDYVYIYGMFFPTATLCVMSVCTVIILYHLRKSSKFRSGSMKTAQLSVRDRKVIKLLVVIIVFYIIYTVPWLFYNVILLIVPAYTGQGYARINNSVYQIVEIFSVVNSCANIFIFYLMSSEFKLTLRKMFCLPINKSGSR